MPDALRRLPPPRVLLSALVLAQWAAALAFALTVRHNGWLYGWRRYQGGDDLVYHALAWLLGTGSLPYATIGYGWPVLLAPVAGAAGPLLVDALPAVVLLQALVLAPVGTLCVYGIAERLAGRLFAAWAAVLWVVIPFAAIPLFVPRYHGQYVEQLLPHVFGLMYQGDFPSMIAVLVSAYFLVRAVDTGAWADAVLAGLAAGFAAGIKPANLVFVPAPLLALVVARRWPQALQYAVALVPALLTLALWKQRGLGQLPVLSAPAVAVSAGAGPLGFPGTDALHRYAKIDLGHLHENAVQLREYFYSVRLLEWAPVAGAVALLRRRAAHAVFLFAWLALYVLVKGSSASATVYYSGTFFRLLLPAFPAFLLLAAAIPLLLPHQLLDRVPTAPGALRPLTRRALALAAVVAVVAYVPALLASAFLSPTEPGRLAYFGPENAFAPVDESLRVQARRERGRVVLRWTPPDTRGTETRARVLRSAPGRDCLPDPAAHTDSSCTIAMRTEGVTGARAWVVRAPRGRWTYRVALVAPWLDDETRGGALLLSPPLEVSVTAR